MHITIFLYSCIKDIERNKQNRKKAPKDIETYPMFLTSYLLELFANYCPIGLRCIRIVNKYCKHISNVICSTTQLLWRLFFYIK